MIRINGNIYEVKFFPDGTLNMTDSFIQKQDDESIVDIEWKFENLTEQVVIYNLTHFIKDKLGARVALWLPYLPNARMDRTHTQSKEVHTLKYFAKFINDLQFDRVFLLDVHSPVALSLIDRAIETSNVHFISDVLSEIEVNTFFFPDKGARDRYGDIIRGEQVLFGEKVRNWETGKIIGLQIVGEADRDKNILIVDDISSYGGTFHHAANALRTAGYTGKIYLAVTHCENSILNGEAIKNPNIEHIFTTYSLYTGDHHKITAFDYTF